MKMNNVWKYIKFFSLLLFVIINIQGTKIAFSITPYKSTDVELYSNRVTYEIPSSERYAISRDSERADDGLIYYFSPPRNSDFPIAIVCGGSTLENEITSIIHIHRYFLKEFHDLNIGVLTVEQQGVDGMRVNTQEFMENYTRSNRLKDHQKVMNYLINCPTEGWNGKFILFGASEGGPIVTTLSEAYAERTVATVNWAGVSGHGFKEELWCFMQDCLSKRPCFVRMGMALKEWISSSRNTPFPSLHSQYDVLMDDIQKNPTVHLKLAGMTYQYLFDATVTYPKIDYAKIITPYLVVIGELDPLIESYDSFIKNAEEANMLITCVRRPDTGHCIRKDEVAVAETFAWIKRQVLTEACIKR